MSATIVTKNNISFSTNINGEQILGKLCKMAGAKYFSIFYDDGHEYVTLSHDMTNDESLDAAEKIKILMKDSDLDELFSNFKSRFEKSTTIDDFKGWVYEYVEIFETCGGYECLG